VPGPIASQRIVVVSHGSVATSLLQAVEMIAGPQQGIYAVEIAPGESPEDFAAELDALLGSIAPDPVLILVDLVGGTPYNVAARHVVGDRFECVSGANLPMLLELVMSRGDFVLAELAATAESAGRAAIRNLGPQLRAAKSGAAR
jgi:mannose/fructose/sorbose-specific phosphotransferase system IIA component